jgi:hypothetical protein
MAKVRPLQYGVDLIEDGGWVVLEDGDARTFKVPRAWLPANVREGDVVSVSPEEDAEGVRCGRFVIDPAARQERLQEAQRRRDRLPKGPKGDVSL